MPHSPHAIVRLLQEDPRFKLEAYQFVRDALAYVQDNLKLGEPSGFDPEIGQPERHISGQQLCHAIRLYAIEQFGYMALLVLKNWGIRQTSDFGDIVYNMIRVGLMKKSKRDRREDFDDVYEFEKAFRRDFKISLPE